MNKNAFNHSERLKILLASSVLTLLAACGGSATPPMAPDVAVTAGGDAKAVDRLGMRSYFAIPFAAPPVGDLRRAAPAPPQKWTTALEKTKSAAPCLQTSASPFRLSGDSEDCLYLDVHAPTGEGPFPVMVNIHGGAFNTGGTAPYADPSPLVSKGVIVVNIAYRLGAMGFLAHPALAANGAAGNYGIMDQQAALKWVQENITNFAGDKNVTQFNVAGETLYLSPVLDLYNGEIVAFETAKRPVFELVSSMLKKALAKLGPNDRPMLHSDQGWQYRMPAYQRQLQEREMVQSMSRKGNCLDNAAMESFFAVLKSEFSYLNKFGSVDELQAGLADYIHYYNNDRIKLKLKGLSPVQYRTQPLAA